MTTPKIVWQTWKSKTDIPNKFLFFQKQWEIFHSGYTFKLLDDSDLEDKIARIVPQYLKKYKNFSYVIERVDFSRYAILYAYGGVYADMDTYPVKCIDSFLRSGKVVLGTEPKEHSKKIYSREVVYCNAVMISPPGERLWLDLMEYIIDNYSPGSDPVYTTGPMVMTMFFETPLGKRYLREIIITDPCVFYPMVNTGEYSDRCNKKDVHVVHVWENSWTGIFNNKGKVVMVVIVLLVCLGVYFFFRCNRR